MVELLILTIKKKKWTTGSWKKDVHRLGEDLKCRFEKEGWLREMP